ncbi:unnamed protein product, partial [Mesorhabditis spiculigera]
MVVIMLRQLLLVGLLLLLAIHLPGAHAQENALCHCPVAPDAICDNHSNIKIFNKTLWLNCNFDLFIEKEGGCSTKDQPKDGPKGIYDHYHYHHHDNNDDYNYNYHHNYHHNDDHYNNDHDHHNDHHHNDHHYNDHHYNDHHHHNDHHYNDHHHHNDHHYNDHYNDHYHYNDNDDYDYDYHNYNVYMGSIWRLRAQTGCPEVHAAAQYYLHPGHSYMSKDPRCRYHHLYAIHLHQELGSDDWFHFTQEGPYYKPDKRLRREVAVSGAPIKRIRLRQRSKRDDDPNVFIYYPINPTYNPKCRREDFDKLSANELALASMKLHFGCYEGTWCEEQNAFPSEILANASLARICYPRPLKTYILGKGRYKPWCTDPHGNQFEPKNVASWGCMVLPFCKLDQPGELDEQKYLRPIAENGDLLNCMDICPRNANGRGLTDKPDCRPIPSNPENDYFGVLKITEKMDWCDVEKSRLKDPWSLNPPCNPIPQCRGNVDGRAPDARDWRKNLLYYQKNVAGVPCVVYKQCSALTEEERLKYHCVGSIVTTSTTKASTTTTAKTTAKTTTEKPNDGLGDE